MIRIHQKGQKMARLQTAVKIDNAPRHWAALDKKRKQEKKKPEWGKWVIRATDADALNAKILAEYKRVQELIQKWQEEQLRNNPDLDQPTLSNKQIVERYKNRLSDAYFDLTAKVLENSKALAYRTYVNRQSAVNLFAEFAGDDLPLSAVTVPYVESFQTYLRNEYTSPKTKQRLKPSSINQYMEAMNTVHVEVLRLKGHTKKKAMLLSPFTDVDGLKTKSAYRSKFDEEQIQQLGQSFPESKRRRITPEEAFSVWVLSHLLAGMRFSDLIMLRYQHFDVNADGQPEQLTYTMKKTGNVVSIPLFDEARQLLARWWRQDAEQLDYVLPYLNKHESFFKYPTREALYTAPFEVRRCLDTKLNYWDGEINQVLAEIEKNAKLKTELRMHNARHSFADLARRIMQEDGTLDILDITRMLGQTDYRMVMIYIEQMEKQDSTKSMKAIFGRKKKPEISPA